MFPTGVGMNRTVRRAASYLGDVPHRRGDEPDQRIIACQEVRWKMFPTGVGMNRGKEYGRSSVGTNVPHRRGDEPIFNGLFRLYPIRKMFPTGVGMNRTELCQGMLLVAPHMFPTGVGMNRNHA